MTFRERNEKSSPGRGERNREKWSVNFDFCRDLEVLKSLILALKRKYTLSERSEFVYFRFTFSKNQGF